jgi:16S rRNA (uracil1498-N3)-methyltransferase
MSQHRFFITPSQITGSQVKMSGEQARQIYQVLRLRPPQTIIVLDNAGRQYEVALDTVGSDHAAGTILTRSLVTSEPAARVTLYQSMLKKDNFEWILQKGTEVGVARFVPVISQRSIVRQQALKQNKHARWERILSEAAEQSERGLLPTLAEPLNLADAFAAGRESDLALIPWEEETQHGLLEVVREARAGHTAVPLQIALFIGPEGGFAEQEITLARAAGVIPVTLGPRILRAETAAIVAAALLLGELGELG